MLHLKSAATILVLVAWASLATQGGCRTPATLTRIPDPPTELTASLPSLAVLENMRLLSDTTESLLLGSEYFTCSDDAEVTPDGLALRLYPTAAPLAWAIYRIWVASTREPRMAQLELAVASGQAYVALSNYARGSWEIHGPVGNGYSEFPLTLDFRSPSFNTYIAVICQSGTDLSILNVRGRLSSHLDWDTHVVEYAPGAYTNVAIEFVAGSPIIVYREFDRGALRAASGTRSLPTSGEHWSKSTIAPTFTTPPEYAGLSITTVDGRAAVSYAAVAHETIWYARALVEHPASDTDWVTMLVDNTGEHLLSRTSLCAVDGLPWIAYDHWPGFGSRIGHLAHASRSDPVAGDWETYDLTSVDFDANCVSVTSVDNQLCIFGRGKSPGGNALFYGRASNTAPDSIGDFILHRIGEYEEEGDSEVLGKLLIAHNEYPMAACLVGTAVNYGSLRFYSTSEATPNEATDWAASNLDSPVSNPAIGALNNKPFAVFYRNVEHDIALARAATAFPQELGDWDITTASVLLEAGQSIPAVAVHGNVLAMVYVDPVTHYLYFSYMTE